MNQLLLEEEDKKLKEVLNNSVNRLTVLIIPD
jgi:hypothetical protein